MKNGYINQQDLQNWKRFLRDNNKKTGIFHFLADWLSEADMPCLVIVTKEEDVCCNRVIALEDLAPCTQEEADPHIFVHARHAAKDGSNALMIKANNMDVVVIAIFVMKSLNEPGRLEKRWIAFGRGGNLRLIPLHTVVNTIGPEKASGRTPILSRDPTLCLLSVAKERSLHGKHGMSVKGSRPPSPNSVIV